MKDIPDDLSQRFIDAAMKFAADLNETIFPCDSQHSRIVRRIKLRQDFVDAYSAIKEFENDGAP